MNKNQKIDINFLQYQDTIQAIKTSGKNYIPTFPQQPYPNDFVTFMDQMIHGKKQKRKEVIARSGLAEDYAYKLLNGGKRTRERDYIIAICVGARLNIHETQHALICSGMLPLSETDIRSSIIILGIQNGLSVYHINEHLEEQKLPLIRTSNDMPSAKVTDSFCWDPSSNSILVSHGSNPPEQKSEDKEDHYTITELTVLHDDLKPDSLFADTYTGKMTVTDEQNNHFYLEVIISIEEVSCNIYIRNEDQYQQHISRNKNQLTKSINENITPDYLGHYNTLLEVTKSDFFPYLLRIDQEIDHTILRHIEESDDTKNFGMRTGARLTPDKKEAEVFIEYYNSSNPDSNEYFQIIRRMDGSCTFTGSHESHFMDIRLGSLYKDTYNRENPKNYFLKTDSDNINNIEPYYKYKYREILYHLNQYIIEEWHGFGIDEQIIIEENLEFVNSLSIINYNTDDYKACWQNLLDAERFISYLDGSIKRDILSVRNNEHMYYAAQKLNKKREIAKRKKLILDSKVQAFFHINELTPEDQNALFSPICNVLFDIYNDLGELKQSNEGINLIQEMLDLIENHHALSDSNYSFKRMYIYCQKAWLSDHNYQLAEKYYQKCLKEILKYHLDNSPDNDEHLAIFYNNYAALLRDHNNPEEALIYYSRGLEIFEAAKYAGRSFNDYELSLIGHIGDSMTKIHERNGKEYQKERLLKRLEQLKAN